MIQSARYSIPLLLGLATTAVILGAGIAMLSEQAAPWLLAAGVATIPVVVLVASTAPAAFAKSRNLARGFRWWHGLWFLALASALVFRARDVDAIQRTPLDLWALWRIGLVAVIALVLMTRLATRRTNWGAALLRGLPAGLFLYGLISVASTLWSVYPAWTLYKSLEYLIDVALLAAIVTAVRNTEELKSLFDWTWLLTGLLLLTVWLSVVLRPGSAVGTGVGLIGIRIEGVLPLISANGVGDAAATLLIVAATRLLFRRHHRRFYWLVCLAAFVTLILAQSRSPATGALLGLLAVLVFGRRFGLLALVGLGGAALLSLTSAEPVIEEAFLRGQDLEMFYSLTGRANWWAYAWEIFHENPLLGLGGYAAGRFAVLGAIGATETSTLHSTWLEILLGVGLLGLLPFLATFVATWLNLLRPLDPGSTPPIMRELRIEAVGIFVLFSFRSIFSDEFIWHPSLGFLLVLAYAELLRTGRLEGIPAADGRSVEPTGPARRVRNGYSRKVMYDMRRRS